jgi:hypothetical protein
MNITRRAALAVIGLTLGACAAQMPSGERNRIVTNLPTLRAEQRVQIIDERSDEDRLRQPVSDPDGHGLPAIALGDVDLSPGKLELLAHYLAEERNSDEPTELRVRRLDVLLWYPTAGGGGFSVGYIGRRSAAAAGGYHGGTVFGDAVTIAIDADFGTQPLHIELREPLGNGVDHTRLVPNRPAEIRPAFERAARALIDAYRYEHALSDPR